MEVVNEIYVGGIPLWGASATVAPNGYTPQAAKANVLYSGSLPVAQSYDNVEEPFELYVKGATADECVANKRALDLALRTAQFSTPCVISLKAKNQTKTGYSEIYSATLQESPEFIGKEASAGPYLMRVTGTWVRAPFWGANALDATSITGATFTNNNSAGGANASLGTLNGDLIYEGSPLNISVTAAAAKFYYSAYLATILSTVYTADGTAIGPSLGAQKAGVAVSIASLPANAAIKCRVTARFTSLTLPSNCRAIVTLYGDFAALSVLATSRVAPLKANTTAQYIDFGEFTLDQLRVPGQSATTITPVFRLEAIDGVNNVGATLHSYEIILYYDWCAISVPATSVYAWADQANTITGKVVGAQNLSGGGYLPLSPPAAFGAKSTGQPVVPARVRGTLPRAFSGAKLMVILFTNATFDTYAATDTFTVTAQHAPLYRTMRGST